MYKQEDMLQDIDIWRLLLMKTSVLQKCYSRSLLTELPRALPHPPSSRGAEPDRDEPVWFEPHGVQWKNREKSVKLSTTQTRKYRGIRNV